jgi:hypothetical protein
MVLRGPVLQKAKERRARSLAEETTRGSVE